MYGTYHQASQTWFFRKNNSNDAVFTNTVYTVDIKPAVKTSIANAGCIV